MLAAASVVVVLADARPAVLFAADSFALVLADARPAALLTPTSLPLFSPLSRLSGTCTVQQRINHRPVVTPTGSPLNTHATHYLQHR